MLPQGGDDAPNAHQFHPLTCLFLEVKAGASLQLSLRESIALTEILSIKGQQEPYNQGKHIIPKGNSESPVNPTAIFFGM